MHRGEELGEDGHEEDSTDNCILDMGLLLQILLVLRALKPP